MRVIVSNSKFVRCVLVDSVMSLQKEHIRYLVMVMCLWMGCRLLVMVGDWCWWFDDKRNVKGKLSGEKNENCGNEFVESFIFTLGSFRSCQELFRSDLTIFY